MKFDIPKFAGNLDCPCANMAPRCGSVESVHFRGNIPYFKDCTATLAAARRVQTNPLCIPSAFLTTAFVALHNEFYNTFFGEQALPNEQKRDLLRPIVNHLLATSDGAAIAISTASYLFDQKLLFDYIDAADRLRVVRRCTVLNICLGLLHCLMYLNADNRFQSCMPTNRGSCLLS